MNDNDTRFLWLSRNIAIFIYGYAFGQTGGQRSGFFRGNTGKAAAADFYNFLYPLQAENSGRPFSAMKVPPVMAICAVTLPCAMGTI